MCRKEAGGEEKSDMEAGMEISRLFSFFPRLRWDPSLPPSLSRVPLKVFGERSKWSSRWAPPSPAHVTLCLEVSEFVLAAANRRHI